MDIFALCFSRVDMFVNDQIIEPITTIIPLIGHLLVQLAFIGFLVQSKEGHRQLRLSNYKQVNVLRDHNYNN
jgi:hypothetical protein